MKYLTLLFLSLLFLNHSFAAEKNKITIKHIEQKNRIFFHLNLNEKRQGHAWVEKQTNSTGKKTFALSHLFIAQQSMGQGLGQLLLSHIKNYSAQHNTALNTHSVNLHGIKKSEFFELTEEL